MSEDVSERKRWRPGFKKLPGSEVSYKFSDKWERGRPVEVELVYDRWKARIYRSHVVKDDPVDLWVDVDSRKSIREHLNLDDQLTAALSVYALQHESEYLIDLVPKWIKSVGGRVEERGGTGDSEYSIAHPDFSYVRFEGGDGEEGVAIWFENRMPEIFFGDVQSLFDEIDGYSLFEPEEDSFARWDFHFGGGLVFGLCALGMFDGRSVFETLPDYIKSALVPENYGGDGRFVAMVDSLGGFCHADPYAFPVYEEALRRVMEKRHGQRTLWPNILPED